MIRVQEQPFDIGQEIAGLKKARTQVGGTAVFVGSVREMNEGYAVSAMTLEHYPGMTEKSLLEIEKEARARWPLDDVLIVHRIGRMEVGEDIVLVVCTSAHRDAAFDACRFLMDFLKTRAPFWKLEEGEQDARWLDARDSDDTAAERWTKA